MDKVISWSHSAMAAFETCEFLYQAERVTKTVKRMDNPQSIFGNEGHAALEHRLREGVILEPRFAHLEPVARVVEKREGDLFIEHEVSLNIDKEPCTWTAPDVWVRGILDVLIVNGDTAWVKDWKFGKVKPDSDQLMLFALFVFAHFPEVMTVHTEFIWLMHQEMTRDVYYRRDEARLWVPFLRKYDALVSAFDTDVWKPKPSGLCLKHCGNTDCEYYGKGTRRR